MAQYAWQPRSMISADAQEIGERLEKIGGKNNNRLSPKSVLKDARKKSSPLHKLFTWDDSLAAEKYRLGEARHIIRNITVVVEDLGEDQAPVRAYYSISHKSLPESTEAVGTYLCLADAMADPDTRRMLLAQILDEAARWRERGKHFRELAEVFEALDRVAV